ncbi:general substrate transporter [Cryomyces antarcticus]
MFGSQARGRTLNWLVTAACCQGFLLLGYDQGVMSGLIGANNQFGHDFNSPNTKIQGLIVSIYDIGCAVGCLGSFTFGEHVGRKKMIIAGASTMIIGTVILASATTLAQLLVGRIVTGIGNGFNSSNIPVYQSELCDASIRGRLVSLQGTITIVGLCVAYWMDYGLSFVSGPVQWRLPIAFQGLFAIGLLFQILPLPESPRWLIEAEQKDKASEVLARLVLGDKADVTHPDVVHQSRQIETSLAIESAGGPFRYKELLQGGEVQNFRRIVLCCAVNLMQQFTGANMINYYAPVVYQNAMGLSRNMSLILGGCTSMTYLAASFIPLWTVDRYGRRALLMFSAAGMCFCFSMTSILLSVGSLGAAYSATAMVFLFQVFLGVGWLPIPWLCPAELTTTRIRSRGQSIGVFLNWMCVFTVVQITPIAIGNIGWHTFIIFAIFCALWVPIVYAFFPETNQLELEDLDHIFAGGDKITRGVWGAKGGYTVRRHAHERDFGRDVGGDKAHDKKAGHGSEESTEEKNEHAYMREV